MKLTIISAERPNFMKKSPIGLENSSYLSGCGCGS